MFKTLGSSLPIRIDDTGVAVPAEGEPKNDDVPPHTIKNSASLSMGRFAGMEWNTNSVTVAVGVGAAILAIIALGVRRSRR